MAYKILVHGTTMTADKVHAATRPATPPDQADNADVCGVGCC